MLKRGYFKLLFGLTALFLCVIAGVATAQIITINAHIFNVEIAQTQQQLQQGLMFRKELAQNSGMLFVHSRAHMLSMWMKDTLIDLDMLFIDENNKIIGIHTAIAQDLSRINSPSPAKYVLELNAGIAKKRDIKIDDLVKLNN